MLKLINHIWRFNTHFQTLKGLQRFLNKNLLLKGDKIAFVNDIRNNSGITDNSTVNCRIHKTML